MNKAILPAVCLMFAGCASSGIDSSALQPSGAAPEVVASAQQMEISSFTDDTVCRREVRTGTRIGTTRCRSRNEADNAAAKLDEYLTQRDIELMRQQQMFQEQARQEREQAFRQRAANQR